MLELPRPLLKYVRVPFDLPPGPLASTRLDEELIRRGLMLRSGFRRTTRNRRTTAMAIARRGRRRWPRSCGCCSTPSTRTSTDVETQSVWAAGELLGFGGNFNNYVKARDLIKQEGIIFRHLLRLILLCEEFAAVCPADITARGVASRAAQPRRAAHRQLPGGRSDQHRRDDRVRPRRRRGRRRIACPLSGLTLRVRYGN